MRCYLLVLLSAFVGLAGLHGATTTTVPVPSPAEPPPTTSSAPVSATPPTSSSAPAPDATPPSKAYVILEDLRDSNLLLSENKNDAALAKANEALQGDPKSVAGYLLRGSIYTNMRMWDKAQNDFEAAYLLQPVSDVIKFNMAELKFVQRLYDAARPGFVSVEADLGDLGDLAKYKVFLCDLYAGHEGDAAKQLALFNEIASKPSYFYANAAWDLYHHQTEDARGWLISATRIYSPQKNHYYETPLDQLGYLPLPSKNS